MPNFTYLPGEGDPETTQTHGLTFTAGEWTPVPDGHPGIEKLRGNRFFAEEGMATIGNIPAADSGPPIGESNTAELHNSGSGDMVANGSHPMAGIGRPAGRDHAPVDLSLVQCRAARAGLEWSREQLAKAANLGERTITDFERGASTMLAPNKARLRKALESAGVIFDGSRGLWFAQPASDNTEKNSEAPHSEGDALAA